MDYYCWLVWCETKILFWLEDTASDSGTRDARVASDRGHVGPVWRRDGSQPVWLELLVRGLLLLAGLV